ncbi:ribosome biogenesis GTPase Der [Wohlfahrtiimonas chitiniclastica]|uniref:ribosome biogenesis GTPase Der n=1 Tax=Wohlfahrtiimonas chitiniclastica TaxID=400946 RepID=UPI000B99B75C|nr:ribosome biogenesis GTPase Der [Wohlfahrtiimonas chitiniclastica]MBS7816597.1 ribosome biogenesis GTPase Der [Wohlfahrtiimonas chitiniclastica]MBS7822486.1 ribosome biogenesis GTPase Der [Wohlfahrtiimonas chitiniclastica]MBS7830049.1 ribosome biogenesis GTPase Der [Wohlfahrtiimonas chitiniclastica]MBS7832159.1 ribosome biogenesis GTPase Der [Wohlfahrtiimonas chitiniclastica]OYQ77865.1 ribosome biogenesis GTPase Der [Wohlfahrtiimonas chitiniclastica]
MKDLPIIALVGRPNVGKSTLYNALTRTRDALVADQPGLTRDRRYGMGRVGSEESPYIVLDTGGLSGDDSNHMDNLIAGQVWKAVEDADLIYFILDGRNDVTGYDEEIAAMIRRTNKPVVVVVNKSEGKDEDLAIAPFYTLGMGDPIAISAAHNRGILDLVHSTFDRHPELAYEEAENDEFEGDEDEEEDLGPIRLAVLGRPNAGKSTLINRILGEERVLASDVAGTTRDAIEIPFEKEGREFILIDTAGIRRRSRIDDKIEKFSVIKSLEAMQKSNVVVFVFDAHEGLSDQDAGLLGNVLESGRALVLAVNKWDHLPDDEREWIKQEFTRKFAFIDFTKPIFISALHGSNVDKVLKMAINAFDNAMKKFTTNELSNILEAAVHKHHPPVVQGLAPKLRYAHQGGKNPPRIVIHGSRITHVKPDYVRYLTNTYLSQLKLEGTPVRLDFRSGDNPYAVEKAQTKVQADKQKLVNSKGKHLKQKRK